MALVGGGRLPMSLYLLLLGGSELRAADLHAW